MYSLSLELVRSNNVSNRNHLVLIDRVKILRDVLQNKTQVKVTTHWECYKARIKHTWHTGPELFLLCLFSWFKIRSSKWLNMILMPKTMVNINTTHKHIQTYVEMSHCVYVVLSDHNNPCNTPPEEKHTHTDRDEQWFLFHTHTVNPQQHR